VLIDALGGGPDALLPVHGQQDSRPPRDALLGLSVADKLFQCRPVLRREYDPFWLSSSHGSSLRNK
jgi:hypothetical protein